MSSPHDLALWAEIDLSAVRFNVRRLKALLSPETALLAVVKADGYGHGDVEVSRAAVAGGADWLGVARVEEGARLRRGGIDRPILLLAEPLGSEAERAIDMDLVSAVYTDEIARRLSEAAVRLGRVAGVHVKVDTGMHRYGVLPHELASFVDRVSDLPNLELRGIWSHLAVSEESENPFTKRQLERFLDSVSSLGSRARGLMRHLCNSAGIFTLPEGHLEMVRAGVAVYGIAPSPQLQDRVELRPAISVHARVSQVRRLPPGEPVSYGLHYTTTGETTLATAPCGYADGIPRALSGKGEALVGGRRHRIAGTITMDHLMIDVGDARVVEGDEVVLLGRQGDGAITAWEIAGWLGTIPYEVVCGISQRVPRIYKP